LENQPTFKEAIEELEKITDSLESGEIELEKSLALFERGVELIKYCQDKLDGAQAKVELLVDSLSGEIEAAALDETEED
jgi:exodeoxyribonuclease VII small subunit